MIIRLDTQKTERQGTAQSTNKTFTTKTPLLAPPYYQDIDNFPDDVYHSEEIQIFSAEIQDSILAHNTLFVMKTFDESRTCPKQTP